MYSYETPMLNSYAFMLRQLISVPLIFTPGEEYLENLEEHLGHCIFKRNSLP